VTRMAGDWPEWASDCEARRTPEPERQCPESVTLTYRGVSGDVVWRDRVDVATGQSAPTMAAVVPLRSNR